MKNDKKNTLSAVCFWFRAAWTPETGGMSPANLFTFNFINYYFQLTYVEKLTNNGKCARSDGHFLV